MAFFETGSFDADAAETAIRNALKPRELSLKQDEDLFARFRLDRKNICHLLREAEKERARLEFELEERMKYIDSLHGTLSWRLTKPIRAIKKFLTGKS